MYFFSLLIIETTLFRDFYMLIITWLIANEPRWKYASPRKPLITRFHPSCSQNQRKKVNDIIVVERFPNEATLNRLSLIAHVSIPPSVPTKRKIAYFIYTVPYDCISQALFFPCWSLPFSRWHDRHRAQNKTIMTFMQKSHMQFPSK